MAHSDLTVPASKTNEAAARGDTHVTFRNCGVHDRAVITSAGAVVIDDGEVGTAWTGRWVSVFSGNATPL